MGCHFVLPQYRSFKYERMKLRHALFKLDSKYKKNPLYKDNESDVDDEWIAEHEDNLKAREIEKVEKRFAKENEKLEEEDKKPLEDSILQDRIRDVEAEFKRLAKERSTGKADAKNRTPDKIEEAIEKLTDKIRNFKLQMVDRDAGKEVALGTRWARLYHTQMIVVLITDLVKSTISILGQLSLPAVSRKTYH